MSFCLSRVDIIDIRYEYDTEKQVFIQSNDTL